MGYGSLAQAWVGGDASSPAPPIKTTGSGIEVVITGLTRNQFAAVSDDLLTAIFNSGAYASLFYLKGVPKGVRQRFCPLGTWGAYAACLALGCGGKSPALGKGRIGAIQRRIWYSKDGLLG